MSNTTDVKVVKHMTLMPAVCDRCSTIFPSGFSFENCRNVTLKYCRALPKMRRVRPYT